MLSAEQIELNWKLHLGLVDKYIGSRNKRVKEMYRDFEHVAVMAPASSKSWYHNAFPGGYIDHVNRVVSTAIDVAKLWKGTYGGNLDFTQEELIFSALFHDLGKLGAEEGENYLPQTDNWRRDKLQEVYTNNPALDFMLIPDRSIYLLQRYGITLTKKEFLAIKLHDGVFEEGNRPYFFSNQPTSKLRSNIVHILHLADYMASKVEVDLYKNYTTKPEQKLP
jgi:hypothetical protein